MEEPRENTKIQDGGHYMILIQLHFLISFAELIQLVVLKLCALADNYRINIFSSFTLGNHVDTSNTPCSHQTSLHYVLPNGAQTVSEWSGPSTNLLDELQTS